MTAYETVPELADEPVRQQAGPLSRKPDRCENGCTHLLKRNMSGRGQMQLLFRDTM